MAATYAQGGLVVSTEFPYGKNLAKVHEWIGQFDTPSNKWHIQFLGGTNSLDDCEFHFLLHGLDSLTSAHAVLKGSGLGLPIGLKGTVDIPRSGRDVKQMISDEIKEDYNQALSSAETERAIAKPFLDTQAQSNVWRSCYNMSEEKQFITRWTANSFSLSDLSNSSTTVEVVSSSFVVIEMMSLDFNFPGDRENGLRATNMGSAEAAISLPGSTVGKYNCKWEIRSWKNNFYARCPFRKDGDRARFTENRFLHYLPPYSGYLYRTREDYLRAYPKEDYPFWQDLFPQLNESVEHFMNSGWVGPAGGWINDVPESYIREYGP
jgi:hypothetical protein